MIDEKALLAWLEERAKRNTGEVSQLVISAVYAGLADRIRHGQFEAKEE